MKKIIVSLSVGFLFLAMSCSEKKEEINGYWISAGYSLDREFTTFYINDSVFIENPFGIYRYERYILHHGDTTHELFYPFDSWPTAGIFYVEKDTLIYIRESPQDTTNFIRFIPESIGTDLTFSEYPISIALPEEEGYSVIEEKMLAEDFFIGNLKKGNHSKYPEINPDSILIQVYDKFILFTELTDWINRAKAKVDEFERDKIIISIYADVETPESFLKEIKAKVEQNGLRTARAYKNPVDNKIYFKMMD